MSPVAPEAAQADATGSGTPTDVKTKRTKTSRRRDWPWLVGATAIGLVAGLTVCLFALFDVYSISNWIGSIIAVLAHGGIALFVVLLVFELAHRPRRRNVIAYLAAIVLLGFIVYKVDEFVARTSPIAHGWKLMAVDAAFLAILGYGLLVLAIYAAMTAASRSLGWPRGPVAPAGRGPLPGLYASRLDDHRSGLETIV